MFQVDNNSAVATMPPLTAAGAPGWFTAGAPGVPPTYPGPEWFNVIQAELMGVLTAAGVAPDKAKLNQLEEAISKLAKAAFQKFGLGVSQRVGINDCNAVTENGLYYAEGALNTPTGVDGHLLHMQYGNTQSVFQLFQVYNGELYRRKRSGETWEPWDPILANAVLVGAVSAFAMSSAPTGWLKCNGAAISRAVYADLFAKIGTTFGSGDGASTFNLPDLRGEFLRGFDDARGADPGRVFGSWQRGSLILYDKSSGIGIQAPHSATIETDNPATFGADAANTADYPGVTEDSAASSNYALGSYSAVGMSRPRNIALLYCIKY